MTYSKHQKFEKNLQEMAKFARVFCHPARLAIINYLAEKNTCISGDITKEIPLSRTTVSQHLQELKSIGLIIGEIDGVTVNYCISKKTLNKCKKLFSEYFSEVTALIDKGNVCKDDECDCEA